MCLCFTGYIAVVQVLSLLLPPAVATEGVYTVWFRFDSSKQSNRQRERQMN